MQKEPINTSPLEQFIQQVKSAKLSNAKDVKLNMQQAEILALTIGQVESRLHGELERLVADNATRQENEVVNLEMDGGGFKE
jgi:hypothetical protein